MTYCLSILAEVDAMLRGKRHILIASDFDGTLCAIADTPSDAHVTPAMLEVLRRVTACENLTLALITGRSIADMKRALPLHTIAAGNHGLEIDGCGVSFEHAEARRLRPLVARACEALQEVLNEWPATWVENKGLTATLHFRRVAPHGHRALLFAARRSLATLGPQIALRVGRLALEVRPRVAWDKGKALGYIRAHMGPFDACVCLGDERTDEAMFGVNHQGINIRVGGAGRSCAAHYLDHPAEVAIFLSHVVDVCASSSGSTRSQAIVPLFSTT